MSTNRRDGYVAEIQQGEADFLQLVLEGSAAFSDRLTGELQAIRELGLRTMTFARRIRRDCVPRDR